MKHFDINGHSIAYQDVGTGTAILFAHCSSATHKEWSSLTQELQNNYRILAPDLLGYGDSEKWSVDKSYDALDDARVIEKCLKLTDKPAHVVAHSYGGAMALEAARVNPERIKSLTLIEPASFHLLKLDNRDSEWRQISSVASEVIAAINKGEAEKAAKAYMVFWAGRIKWFLMPRKMKHHIIETIEKVAAEFSGIHNDYTSLSDYRSVTAPVRLIMGSKTTRPAKAIIDILSKTLPDIEVTTLKGAGHMSPFTHKSEINALAKQHISKHEI